MADTRYMAAHLPAPGAHLSVLTMTLPNVDGDCEPLRGRRTIVRIDIVEAKAGKSVKPSRARTR